MVGISRNFFKVDVGTLAQCEGRGYRVTHLISANSVIAEDLETKESKRLFIDALKILQEKRESDEMQEVAAPDILQYSEEEWAEAQRRLKAIKPLLQEPIRTRARVEIIAKEHGVHAATLYKWLNLFQSAGHVSVLIPSKRGRKTGTTFLDEHLETIISSAIQDEYLTKQRGTPQDVIDEVLRRCRLAKVVPPHANTVRNRLAALKPASTLRARGFRDKARDQYGPIQGNFPDGTYPLAAVQIDHTPTNVVLVDEKFRQPIGRAWLTLAIDTFSRMIVGLFISFERPDAAAVGICMARGICTKREYLAQLDVPGDWSVWGVPAIVYVDNAKEFRSMALERGADEYGIDLQWRPVKTPNFGGHIERMMGNVGNHDRKLPGATFSKPDQRVGYDSDAEAALTVREYEQKLVDFIVNIYHQRRHSALGMSPSKRWELGVNGDGESMGTGSMPIPENPVRIEIDFMPVFERTVQRYGIQLDNIFYYNRALDRYINAADPDAPDRKRNFIVRRHPSNISKIYFLDPADNRYIEIPYRNIGHPPITIWELRHVLAILKKQSEDDIDEDRIFTAIERMRTRVQQAVATTKAARRQQARNPASESRPASAAVPGYTAAAAKPQKEPASAAADDPFAMDILPFDQVTSQR